MLHLVIQMLQIVVVIRVNMFLKKDVHLNQITSERLNDIHVE